MAERVSNKQILNKLPVSANDLKTIRWFVRNYARHERIHFLFVVVLLGVSAATSAGLAWLIKPAFDGAIIGRPRLSGSPYPSRYTGFRARTGTCLWSRRLGWSAPARSQRWSSRHLPSYAVG